MDQNPVYLIASERSGTNLLRKLFTQHQDVYFGASPAHFLKHLFLAEPYYYVRHGKEKGFAWLVDDALALCYVHFSPWQIKISRDEVLSAYKERYEKHSAVLLSHLLMEHYARKMGYASYFCKDNNVFDYVFSITNEIPQAKFVYLYRDPRDVVSSQKQRLLQSDSIVRSAKLWKREQVACIRAQISLGDQRCIGVRYEDLVRNPDNEIQRICEFFGVEYVSNERDINFMAGGAQEWENLDKPVMKNNTNKYKKRLSLRQIKTIESIALPQLQYLGYQETVNLCQSRIDAIYRLYDRWVVHARSLLRRKFFVKKAVREWSVERNKLTKSIASRY